jgi:hypothetical protein
MTQKMGMPVQRGAMVSADDDGAVEETRRISRISNLIMLATSLLNQGVL